MLISRQRRLTLLEHLLGVPSARKLRRRFGWILIGAGLSALRPRRRVSPVLLWTGVGTAAGLFVGRLA
jgi:hypothetical protein